MDNRDLFLQAAFDLVSYYQSGNDTSLRAIFDKARIHSGWMPPNEKFWYANVRFAFELAGIVEVVESPSSQRWSFCAEVNAELPPFGTKLQLLSAGFSEQVLPSISTDEGLQLYRLIPTEELVANNQVLSTLLSRLPVSAEIESAISNRVRGLPDTSRGIWEWFDLKKMRWFPLENPQNVHPGLFRSWERSTGRTVWIVDHQGNSLSFVSPEWATMFAAKRNGIEANNIFAFENESITIPRAFKLPRIILKELTLISQSIHIDWNINFVGISEVRYLNFLDTLSKKGLVA